MSRVIASTSSPPLLTIRTSRSLTRPLCSKTCSSNVSGYVSEPRNHMKPAATISAPVRAVVRPPCPGVEPAADERPSQDEAERAERHPIVRVVAPQDEHERKRTGGGAGREQPEPGSLDPVHPSSDTRASPEGSAFGTKPRAPL